MTPEQIKAMSEPFPRQVVKRDPRGMSYIPVSEIVARMNATIGVGNWTSEVISATPWGSVDTGIGTGPAHIVCHVRVNIKTPEGWVSMDGFGGQDVSYYGNKSKGPLNLGDSYKGAASDAMKKALQHFGVALDLARDDAVLEAERRPRPVCPECGLIFGDDKEMNRAHMVDDHGWIPGPDGKPVAP